MSPLILVARFQLFPLAGVEPPRIASDEPRSLSRLHVEVLVAKPSGATVKPERQRVHLPVDHREPVTSSDFSHPPFLAAEHPPAIATLSSSSRCGLGSTFIPDSMGGGGQWDGQLPFGWTAYWETEE
ncbi:hypothetical protein EJB05_53012, partial [Eragrostis curvula]